jgi:CBS domain containing-hemolysin-like protein
VTSLIDNVAELGGNRGLRDGGSPVGLLAFASVAAVPRSEWDTRRVRDTMISLDEVPLLTEDERAVDALTELSAPRANRALVVDNGHQAGLLSITDLARALEVGRRPAQAGRSRLIAVSARRSVSEVAVGKCPQDLSLARTA